MNCSQVLDLISEYIDGVLKGRLRRVVDAHLTGCAECREKLASLQAVVAAAKGIEEVHPPSGLKARIMRSVTEAGAQCAEVRGLFSAYVDNELAASERALVTQHESVCEHCAMEIEVLHVLAKETSAIAELEPPAGLRERIAAATTERKSVLAQLRLLVDTRARQWAFGAAAAAVVVGVFASRGPQVPVVSSGPTFAVDSRKHAAKVAVVPQQADARPASETPSAASNYGLETPSIETPMQVAAVPVSSEASAQLPEVPEVERAEPEPVVVRMPEPEPTREPEPVKPVVTPPPAKKESPRIERDPLVKVAVVVPSVSSDNGEWIRQMKTSSAMQVSDVGKTAIRTTDARF